jgi:hypothetical protein
MMFNNIPMILGIEKCHQRLLELRLDVEKVQVYVLENASPTESLTQQPSESTQPSRRRLELAVPQ